MANFKRKRPRTSGSGTYSANGLKHRLGDRFDDRAWLRNYPRYWDKTHHIRPARAGTRRLERAVVTGADADGLVWPDGRKPHIYYW
jgi:hypothetical protein